MVFSFLLFLPTLQCAVMTSCDQTGLAKFRREKAKSIPLEIGDEAI